MKRTAENRRREKRIAVYGSDISAEQVMKSRRNLEAAGLTEYVTLEQADILTRSSPSASGVMVCNPPYGMRIGEQQELAAFYPRLGNALKAHWSGWRCNFFSGDKAFPKLIHLKANRRIPLFNGALDCRIYEYSIVTGSMRKPESVTE